MEGNLPTSIKIVTIAFWPRNSTSVNSYTYTHIGLEDMHDGALMHTEIIQCNTVCDRKRFDVT